MLQYCGYNRRTEQILKLLHGNTFTNQNADISLNTRMSTHHRTGSVPPDQNRPTNTSVITRKPIDQLERSKLIIYARNSSIIELYLHLAKSSCNARKLIDQSERSSIIKYARNLLITELDQSVPKMYLMTKFDQSRLPFIEGIAWKLVRTDGRNTFLQLRSGVADKIGITQVDTRETTYVSLFHTDKPQRTGSIRFV